MAGRNELLRFSSGEAEQRFQWSVGLYGSRFLQEIRDNKKFWGVRCRKCKKVYVPPRMVCGPCFEKLDDWVEVSSQGVVRSYTVLTFGFLDPNTGRQRPTPYGYVNVMLDGADSCMPHYLEETDPLKIHCGMRVEAVFEEVRRGSILDIKFFRTLVE